jgi:hypothetical protein
MSYADLRTIPTLSKVVQVIEGVTDWKVGIVPGS